MFKDAFEKAGLPTASIAFASACHDLARLALNREADPKRAMHVWLGMAAGLQFRGPLEEFLQAVAKERASGNRDPVDVRGQAPLDAHPVSAPASTGPSSGGGSGQSVGDNNQEAGAAPPPEPERGGEDQIIAGTQDAAVISPAPQRERGGQAPSANHPSGAAPLAPGSPTAEQTRAVTAAKEISARVMSGIYITERQGSKTPLDDLRVSSLERRLKWHGGRAAQNAVEYNTLWLVREQIEKQAFVPDDANVGDVLDAERIRQLHNLAQAFASAPMITLPDTLKGELAA